MAYRMPNKDPSARLDYVWDWRQWLAAGDSIATYAVAVPMGLVLDEAEEAGGVVTAWFTGGSEGSAYEITCAIVTTEGREDERSILIPVRDR